MTFKDLFQKFSDGKELITGNKVDKTAQYDQSLRLMGEELERKIQDDMLRVRSSIGQGQYAAVPWICILSNNKSIAIGPKKGIYIVLLFSTTGKSFYLALSQGITNFEEMKHVSPKERDQIIEKVVDYYQGELSEHLFSEYHFKTENMDLGENLTDLPKGYIKTTIISKRYDLESFDEKDFYETLFALINEYKEIIFQIDNKTYDDVIQLVSNVVKPVPYDDALEKLEIATKNIEYGYPELPPKPMRVYKVDEIKVKYSRISSARIATKQDYLKLAEEQHNIGIMGEKLAMEIEGERLYSLGLDPNLHLRWISEKSDSYGYDIEFVDFIEGKLQPIFIEVKASRNRMDVPFFITSNELNVSIEKKSQFRLFRIYDLMSLVPKYYFADGNIKDNFYLDPSTYTARYKYSVSEM